MYLLRTKAQVVQCHAQDSAQHGKIPNPLRRAFPEAHDPWNVRIFRQAAISLGIGDIVKHIDDAGSAHARWIVNSRFLDSIILAKLFGASFCQVAHVLFTAEVEAAGRTRLDASWLQSLAHPVHAQRALEHLFGSRIELGNIERASTYAVSAANAILLLKVHDAVGVLHNRAIGGTGRQTAGIGAVHALIFAHEQRDAAIFAFVLVELDQIPVIPRRRRHGLVAVVEYRVGEAVSVPFEARHFAGFAADAGGSVDQLANLIVAIHVFAGRGSGVAGNSTDCQRCLAHTFVTPSPPSPE